MNDIPYFSVIVPAYQAEKTIKRCLDSIINQSYIDFEIIVINDGSKDNTLKICKEYEADNRIRIISQANRGISATRQLGLELSTGKYIQFIDSDDWVDTSFLEELFFLLKSNDYDMVILDYYADKINKSEYKSLGIKSLEKEALVKGLVSNIPGVLWNKVVKRELFSKYNVDFNSGLSYCEDWVVTYKFFNSTSKIFYYKKAFYHYDLYSNPNSLARVININTLKSRYDYLEYIKRLGIKILYPRIYETQYASYAYIVIRSNLYDASQYRKEFEDLSIKATYLPIYKKIILYVARIFNVRVAYYFDNLIRKLQENLS